MEEVNKDFMLLDDEDDENSRNFNNSNMSNPFLPSHEANILRQSKNPFISSNKPKSPVSTISIQRPRSSSQIKNKGLDEYIETYKKSPLISKTNATNNNLMNDNRIKINLPIEDLSIKNENKYQTLDDHSIMTGDDIDVALTSHKRVSSSRTSSRRQSIDENEDNNADDDNNENDLNGNLKYKYTASYKIDESTGAFKENSRITFEKNEQKFQQQFKKPPPLPLPPLVSKPISSHLDNEFIQVKCQENKIFFNDFLSKSDNLIAKTQMKLEELSKKSVPIASLPRASTPIISQPITTQPPTIPQNSIKLTSPSPSSELVSIQTTLVPSTLPINSKSLIDLKSFDVPQPNNVPIRDSQIEKQSLTQIDLLLDINHGEYCLNTESLKQGDSYFDLIGLNKSDSQYILQQQQNNDQNENKVQQISNDILCLDITQKSGITPLTSPFKDEFLDFVTSDNLLCFADTKITSNSSSISIKKGDSCDLLRSISNDFVVSNNTNNNNLNEESKFIGIQMQPAPEIQITEPLTEQNDDNIVPDGLFNLKNEVPYNQSRPVTPAGVASTVCHTPHVEQTEKKSNDELDTFLNFETNNVGTSFVNNLQNEIIQQPTQNTVVKPTTIARSRFKPSNHSKVKTYVRKDGVMSNDDKSSSSSEEDNESAQFKIRIRPRVQSVSNLDDENQNNTSFQLLSKPPKTAEEIQNFQLARRQSQESINLTQSLAAESSDEERIGKPDEIMPLATEVQKTEQRDRKQSEISEISIEMPDEDDNKPLEEFLDETLGAKEFEEGWILMIRYPLRNPQLMYKNALHKITEIRAWTETIVKISDEGRRLKLYYPHDLENPFHEIELKSVYKFTDLTLQQYDTYTKIHTFKIQEIIFKEMIQMRPDRLLSLPERFLKHFSKPKVTSLLDHTPIPFEVIKFAHLNHKYISNFLAIIQENFWKLPITKKTKQRELQQQKQQQQQQQQQQLQTNVLNTILPASLLEAKHAHEEITIKVIDEYKCVLDKKCRILKHKCRTRIFLVAFLNIDEPIIEVGLNDCLRHGKEIVGRHDIIPIKTETWISPETFELNKSIVNEDEFEKTHCLKCCDVPDNQIIEIMRYRTRPRRNYELPLQVHCTMTIVKRKIEIKIECMIAGTYFTKLSEVFCENIQIRFPLPDAWVYLFRVEKRFRYGALHSTKSKFGKLKGLDRFLLYKGNNSNSTSSSSSSNSATMEASCGSAKYEQAFKSIVWRIDQLPLKNKDVYKTQLFLCRINLQEYDTLPETYHPNAEVQFTMPICAASKSQVRSISVNTSSDEPPNKWVKLKTKFDYEIEIDYVLDQDKEEFPTLNTDDCDELKHISQSESEVDNDEDEENDEDNENIDNLDKIKQQPSEAVLIDLL